MVYNEALIEPPDDALAGDGVAADDFAQQEATKAVHGLGPESTILAA